MSIVICVELSARAKSDLDEVILQGGYKDYSEAVTVALSNQRVLQRRAAESRAFVLTYDPVERPQQASESKAPPTPNLTTKESLGIPPAFSLASAQACQSGPAPVPDDVFTRASKVTVDRWIFGQHNKLLPVKASCRAIAAMLAERPLGVSLSEAGSRIAKDAAGLGEYLRQLDARSGAIREDALATAFPSAGEDSDKSRLRYTNQFIGNLTTQSQLSGLLVDLKLVNYLRGKEPLLLLTEPGLDFARLFNPILDEPMRSNGAPRPRFSEEEIEFLLHHVKERVPVEDFAFRTVLGVLRSGFVTPESLDAQLIALLPPGKKKVSDAFITTQRSGVISRMSDLDMVVRQRVGIRVKYEATSRGIAYLNGSGGQHAK